MHLQLSQTDCWWSTGIVSTTHAAVSMHVLIVAASATETSGISLSSGLCTLYTAIKQSVTATQYSTRHVVKLMPDDACRSMAGVSS